ncbi:L,D-transpeptidase family protein [Novosphingobium sp. TH158]|uniref:L,D-transpeptidase family protein n=1 Tax=Novosphingobium sp. TH158 TaxID=2067455 RepID=UPI0020B108A0|nr:L,D-transpeptidase family protein [Novosphingobium sp. TH158]
MTGLGAKGWTALVASVGGIVLAGAALLHVEPPAPAAPAKVAGAKPQPAPPPRDERFVIKRVLPISGPIKYGEWHWDEAGVPAGPLVITVDLEARVLSVFRNGYEIAATAVLLGTEDKPTPLGVFPIKWKKAQHFSRTYDNAPMPFTMNITDDGVAIHGTKVENGYASHGCVGVPTPFAQKLFALASVGDKVYITRGKQTGVGQSLTES